MSEPTGDGGKKILFILAGLVVLFVVVYFLLPAKMVPWLYPG